VPGLALAARQASPPRPARLRLAAGADRWRREDAAQDLRIALDKPHVVPGRNGDPWAISVERRTDPRAAETFRALDAFLAALQVPRPAPQQAISKLQRS
jgi:hypothetical protein